MNKKNIAIITGGFSGESVISYKTCATIEANIDTDMWNAYVVDISLNGWFCKYQSSMIQLDKNDFSISYNDEKINFDAVLCALHGTPGEDGKLQGYFDMLNIPYTSCNAASLAVTFNKRYTVAIAAFSGIPVAKSVLYFKHSYNNHESANTLNFPVFVKPNNGGSSIGMSKVNVVKDLQIAIDKAFNEDNQVLIEEFIAGREFTIGVYKTNNKIICLPITEVIAGNEFFDFEAKYEGKSKEITPAEITTTQKEKIEQTAIQLYELFNCNGVIRIDFIYNAEKNLPYMLEINTVPGQSEASIIPQQVKASGGNLMDFYSELIQNCFN